MRVEPRVRVADECWIALALLTREDPDRSSFQSGEIIERLRREGLHPSLRPGVQAHLYQHNVCNRPPSTARYRMFYRLGDGSIRLYRPGDDCDPDRSGKTHPDRSEIPPAYHPLIDWYEKEYCGGAPAEAGDDPILSLRGLGKGIWSNIDPDEYIRELRADWSDETAHAGAVGAAARESFAREPRDDRLWERIVRFQGEQFKTSTGLPFTYEVEGNSGVWFYREGERIDRRVWRGEIESAWKNTPLQSPSGLRKFQCSSYLYGLLTDARIIAGERG